MSRYLALLAVLLLAILTGTSSKAQDPSLIPDSGDVGTTCADSSGLDFLPPLAPGEHTLHLRVEAADGADRARLHLADFTTRFHVAGLAPTLDTKGNRNTRIVLDLYRAFAEGDLDRILEIIHPDVVWIESEGIPYGGTFIGRDAVFEGVFGKIGAEWDGFTAEVDEVIDGGKQVVILGRDSGTYKATGKSMEAPTASVWTLNNKGQVIRFLQVIDTQAVNSAVLP